MAQTRLLSLLAKLNAMECDLKEMSKNIQNLVQMLSAMRKKHFGRPIDLATDRITDTNVQALMQSAHKIDNMLLSCQQLIDRTVTHCCYLQRQLKLRKV